jgi:hypothetical protein
MPNGPGHSPWSGVNAASRVAVMRRAASPASRLRRVTAAAGLGARWVPRELRASFVSVMSYQGLWRRGAKESRDRAMPGPDGSPSVKHHGDISS